MPQVSRSTVISAPIQQVFDVISDPMRVSAIFPGVVFVEGMQLPLKRGSTFRWEYLFLGMRFKGMWTVDELAAPNTYIGTTTGEVSSQVSYTLTPAGEGSTNITVEVEYETPQSLLKNFAVSLIEPHMSGLLGTFLETLKHFIEKARAKQA